MKIYLPAFHLCNATVLAYAISTEHVRYRAFARAAPISFYLYFPPPPTNATDHPPLLPGGKTSRLSSLPSVTVRQMLRPTLDQKYIQHRTKNMNTIRQVFIVWVLGVKTFAKGLTVAAQDVSGTEPTKMEESGSRSATSAGRATTRAKPPHFNIFFPCG